jgi:hypothetical protein
MYVYIYIYMYTYFKCDIAKDCSLLQIVQTGSVAFPSFYRMRTRRYFAGYLVTMEWSEPGDSTLSNTDDKNAWSYIFTLPL